MKADLTALIVAMTLCVGSLAQATPEKPTMVAPHPLPTEKEQSSGLRDEMGKMIFSVADMDIMMNKTQEIDYEILKEDAQRILESVKKIRALDTGKIFKKPLSDLEKPTQKMLRYAQQKDVRAGDYPEQIFSACFRCHTQHRPTPVYK